MATSLEKGSYELLEETLKNTMKELQEAQSKIRKVESEKYNLSLDIMKLELAVKLNSGDKKSDQTLVDLKENHDQWKNAYE